MRVRASIIAILFLGSACGPSPREPAAPMPAPAPAPTPDRPDPVPTPQPRPPADTAGPVFTVEMWPGEGVPVFESLGTPLTLRTRPSPSAPVAGIARVPAGERVTYDDTRYQTIAPASILTLAPATIEGRVLGSIRLLSRAQYYSDDYPNTVITLPQGSRFEFLQYRAEGTCFVRVDGRVIEAEACPSHDPELFRVTGEPVTRWWIHLPSAPGASGWLLVTERAVKLADRTF